MATSVPKSQTNLNTKDSNQMLATELAASLVDGRLPCPLAFKMARKLNISPRVIGEKADELKIRIINCQLGCFGLKKATHEDLRGVEIASNVAEAVKASQVNEQITCETAYELARKLKVSRKKVGDTATQLKIMIVDCQLGCF